MDEETGMTTDQNKMPRLRNNVIMIALTVAMTLLSCGRKTVYDRFLHTDIEGWSRSDTLCFLVDTVKTDGVYMEEVGLRISDAYPFTGITLVVEQQTTSQDTLFRDTLAIGLADRDGHIVSRGITYYNYNSHLRSLDLRRGDSLKVSVRHLMSREVLPGIADVGLRIIRD